MLNRIISGLVLLPFLVTSSFAQVDLKQKIIEISDEGRELYKLEMAAWNGTDRFTESYGNSANIGGYFSYIAKDSIKCVFYSKIENPKVLGSVIFDPTFKWENSLLEIDERDFTSYEKELYTIRSKAWEQVKTDTLYKSYNNTSINIIPLIYKGQKKVYVLTGPQITGVVLFGNDYLLTFDNKNNLLSEKTLHKNLIPVYYEEDSPDAVGSMHSHSDTSDEFITPTDICTLMLYSKFAHWNKHVVLSAKYASIWDCTKNDLRIISRDEFDKMQEIDK